MGPLPVNFEAKLKEPKAINGGYPYSIKAEDLMKNFVDAKLEVDDSIHSSGLQLEEYTAYGDNGHPGRAIRIDPDSVLAVSSNHMWKVSQNGQDGSFAPIFSCLGGIVTIQGTRVVVSDVAVVPLGNDILTTTTASNGFIALKITREEASRVYDSDHPPVVEFYTTLPSSTAEEEFIVLAEVTVSGDVTLPSSFTQCRNDEICSYELLIVANGEFALLPVQANSRNSYAPPLP
jgi:hypothetical protein